MDRFPDDISIGATGGPDYLTDITTNKGGWEKRIAYWDTPIYSFECSHALQDNDMMKSLINFFHQSIANVYPFRFKFWIDYAVIQSESYIDRVQPNTLKLNKIYPNFNKRITKVVSGTFKLYANGSLVNSGFSLDIDTGIVTLQNPNDYPDGTVFTFECEFDFWVRLINSGMRASIDYYNINSWNQIEMVEVREKL